MLEEAPIASHQSLGGVERFHRWVQEMLRTHKHQLEMALGIPLEANVGLASFLVRHCSWLIFRFHVPRGLGVTG